MFEMNEPANWIACDGCRTITHASFSKAQFEQNEASWCTTCGASQARFSVLERFSKRDLRRVKRRVFVWKFLNRWCPQVLRWNWVEAWIMHC